MRKTLTYLFVTLFLSQNFLAYYPVLDFFHEYAVDYRLHKEKYGDDIFTFVAKHFGSLKKYHSEEHKKDQQEHNNKHKHCIFHLHLDHYFLNSSLAIAIHPLDFSKQIFYYRENFTSSYFRFIIDPPDFL